MTDTADRTALTRDHQPAGCARGACSRRIVSVPDIVRTPEEAFANLPDFPFAPHYRVVDGLRLAHIDEGEGAPVLFMHGEPTWSFLWRHLIGPVRDAGYRAIAPDMVGFGRSDKPTDIGWYSYERHVALAASILEDLDLRDATIVVHDWGGPIGLRLAVDHPERIARIVTLDTGPLTGRQRRTDAWLAFRDFVARTEDLPIGMLVRGGCHTDPGEEVIAAYDAPYPDAPSKAGARAFPELVPMSPDAPGAASGRAVLSALREDPRPILMLWGACDPVLPPAVGERFAESIGRPPPRVIEGAGHFLQEDCGALLGGLIVEWLTAEFTD